MALEVLEALIINSHEVGIYLHVIFIDKLSIMRTILSRLVDGLFTWTRQR